MADKTNNAAEKRMDRECLMAKNVACLKTKSAKRAQVHMLVKSLVKGMKGAQHGR